MMFFGGNSNNSNAVSTNTTIYSLYSNDSMLTVGAWNDKINLKFTPSIGKDGNGLNQYDKEKRFTTALSQANAASLLTGIEQNIIPKVVENQTEPTSIAVSMGKADSRNLIVVEYKKDEEDKMRLYLTFVQNVGADGKAPTENIISYKFNQTEIMKNYSNETGKGELITHESEFFNFVDLLRRRTDLLSTIPHSIRYSNEISKKISSRFNNNNNASSTDSFLENLGDEALPFN